MNAVFLVAQPRFRIHRFGQRDCRYAFGLAEREGTVRNGQERKSKTSWMGMVVASVDSLRFRLRGFDISSWNLTLRASASFMTALARLNELRLVVQLCVQYLQTHYIHSLYTEQLSKACSSQSDGPFHRLTGNIFAFGYHHLPCINLVVCISDI